MQITLNIKLASSKESDYTFNVDLDSEGRFNQKGETSSPKGSKTALGAIARPDADRLKMIKNPDLVAEDEATSKVIDSINLDE